MKKYTDNVMTSEDYQKMKATKQKRKEAKKNKK